ncbi:MAG: reverse transcriptase-like protein [Candidatus Thermoplasmatota archaeon]|nr:reverse transcriptase-like protein [Candidatus Thermoplasmatota archaeon]
MLIMEFDGSCLKNPGGPGGYGVVIKKDGRTIDELTGKIRKMDGLTNNRAEYLALIIGLKYLKMHYPEESVICKGDSMLVIKQMEGSLSVNRDDLFDLWKKASKAVKGMNVSFEWIEREENGRADELSRRMVPVD